MPFALPHEKAASAWWREFDRAISGWSVRWGIAAGRVFNAEGARVVKAFVAGGESAAVAAVHDAPWLQYEKSLYLTITPDAGVYVQARLTEQFKAFDIYEAAAWKWLRAFGAKQVAGITGTTRKRIIGVIQKGIEQQLTRDEQAKAIRGLYHQFTESRAWSIARTETTGAANYGSLTAAENFGRPQMLKRWLSVRDARVRDDHVSADGQMVKLSEPFVVGGEKLKHPGDVSLNATSKNIVNCRCTLTYELPGRGRLKPLTPAPADFAKRRERLERLRKDAELERRMSAYFVAKGWEGER